MFYRRESDGITVFIRLTPKAAKDAVAGVGQSADGKTCLCVRVRSVPENGKANKALIRFLSREMKIPLKAFTLAGGATSRFKQLHIAGNSAELALLFDEKLKNLPV